VAETTEYSKVRDKYNTNMDKQSKLKIKITPKKITFWFYFLVIVASIIILSCVSLFLYKNFYQTITQSEEIMILREKVAIETVNMEKFNTIIEKIKQKTILRELNDLNNPFD